MPQIKKACQYLCVRLWQYYYVQNFLKLKHFLQCIIQQEFVDRIAWNKSMKSFIIDYLSGMYLQEFLIFVHVIGICKCLPPGL